MRRRGAGSASLATGAVAGAVFVAMYTQTQDPWTIDDELGVAIAVAGGCPVYGVLEKTMGLRLDPEQQFQGADLSIHHISSTPERESNW